MHPQKEHNYWHQDPNVERLRQYMKDASRLWKEEMSMQDQKDLALELLGVEMYSSAGYWHRYALKMLEEPFDESKYPRKNEVYNSDKRIKQALGSLTKAQRKALGELFGKVCDGVGHSILARLYQPPFGGVCRIAHDNREGATHMFDPSPFDLHELWFRWKDLSTELEKKTNDSKA
jgi:hypothetical protein